MIDLEAIEAEIDDAIGCADGQAPIQCSDAKEIIARLRQAEKDAARYRWLRNDAYNYLSGPMIFNCDYCGNPAPDDDGDVIAMVGVEVDLAIDEAMKCK